MIAGAHQEGIEDFFSILNLEESLLVPGRPKAMFFFAVGLVEASHAKLTPASGSKKRPPAGSIRYFS